MTGGSNWTDAFSSQTVKPSQISYEALTISSNTTLIWPLEASLGSPYVASQIDVTASGTGLNLVMPNALQGAMGQACVITNVGSNTFTVTDSQGNQLFAHGAGQTWLLSLINNTTAAGVWRAIQMGATSSNAQAGALAGLGLEAVGTQLQTELDTSYFSSNQTLTAALRANAVIYNGSGAGTFQLDTSANLTDGWFAFIINEGAGALSITTTASQTINGIASITLPQSSNGQFYSALIVCDGTNFNAFGLFPSPLAIAQGGTGANNPTSALVNFGGSTIGIDIFTAPTVAAVLALLGISQSILTESTVSTNVSPAVSATAYVATAALSITLPLSTTLTKSWVIAIYAQGGAVTVTPNAADKINNGSAGANYTVPSDGSVFFVTDANGNFWPLFVNNSSAGTVTSVAMSDGSTSPIMVISGSPITSSGTLTFILKTQNANLAFMGPTSGGAAQPTFRAIVMPDLPVTDTTKSLAASVKGTFSVGHVLTAADTAGTIQDGGAAPARVTARQSVLNSAVDGNGLPNWLSAGTGLAVSFAATTVPVELAFANGFSATGSSDDLGQFTADTANYWSSLPANITSFLSVDRNTGTGILTATNANVPPQYGPSFDATQEALLHLDGTAGSTTFTDQWGNTWSQNGTAKLQTNQAKFGTAGLGGGGTSNAMNGSTDGIQTTGLNPVLFSGPFTWQCWIYLTATPPSNNSNIMGLFNGTTGSSINLDSSSLVRFFINNGANQVGATTVTQNAWHHIALVHDPVAGEYYGYLDGTKQVQQADTTVFSWTSGTPLLVGAKSGIISGIIGYIDEVQLLPVCLYPGGTTFTPPSAAAAMVGDWFDTTNMVMKTPNAVGPTWNQVERLYVGEALAGASTISSVASYALQGRYIGPWQNGLPGTSTSVTANDNMGTKLKDIEFEIENMLQDSSGYPAGTSTRGVVTQSSGSTFSSRLAGMATRTTSSIATSNGTAFALPTFGGGGYAALTAANWRYRLIAQRAF